MKCHDVIELLPLHLYGDLNDDERGGVEAHLAACANCRAELAALKVVRRGLDATPMFSASIEPAAILRSEADRERRRSRRWRFAAIAAAVALTGFILTRVELRAGNGQLILRWGNAPPAPEVRTVVITAPNDDTAAEERLQTMSELISALAGNVENLDRRQRDELARLRREVTDLQSVNQRRLAETERDVSALYAAQFRPRTRGENP